MLRADKDLLMAAERMGHKYDRSIRTISRKRKVLYGAAGGGLVLSAYSAARAKSSGRNGLVPGSTGGNTGIYGM